MAFDRAPVFAEARALVRAATGNPKWDWTPAAIGRLDAAIDAGLGLMPPAPTEPKWLVEARSLIGQREIPGPTDNSWIAKGWARLGAGWFNDDETPWCGFFVAHCVEAAKLPYPGKGEFARALAWASWGIGVEPRVGAVVVFKRTGGGHVGFLVGEDASNFYVLGGNQANAVNIMALAKTRAVAVRWPAGQPLPAAGLPPMKNGILSTDER